MALHVFGLTGGIGSGKSTVGRWFRDRGLPVIDADQLARDVVAANTPGLAEIVTRFGSGILTEAGDLDRKALATVVFGNDEARRALNVITHPRVAALFGEKTAALAEAGEPLACYEVPLLFEVGLDKVLAPVVVVAAPAAVQMERVVGRDGSTREEALARIAAQLSLEEKVRRADHVIDSTGTFEASHARADDVLDAVCRQLGVDPGRYPRTDVPGVGKPNPH